VTTCRGRSSIASVSLDSAPYRWRFAGDLSGERLAVVVTGASPWFIGRCPGWDLAAASIMAVAAAARSVGGLVVWTVHTGPGRHLPPSGDPAGRVCLDVEPGDVVVTAGGLDGFFAGPLDQVLRARRRDLLVLAGAGFETTVHSTLRSANDRGYECLTLVDAAAAGDESLAGACASTIRMSGGIFGAVADAEELICSLTSLERVTCPSPS
jgi:nicotinamidase-related amidase